MAHTILIIDNARQMHGLIQAHMDQDDIEWHSAYAGDEALSMAVQVRPDVILLDVRMPETDGYEVCRRLKACPVTSAIPIIFLTAASTTEEKVRGLNLGAIDYVTKPFDPAELQARVRGALRVNDLLNLLAEKAQVDGLTGLRNRSYFEQRLESELASARRHGHPLSCLLIDLDHFKGINDGFGHHVGDKVLRATARVLMARCRPEDVVCRYGGDEFTVLAPDTNAAGAERLAQRLRDAVADMQVAHPTALLPVRCSIGSCDLATAGGRSIVEVADAAMFADKQGARTAAGAAPDIRHADAFASVRR